MKEKPKKSYIIDVNKLPILKVLFKKKNRCEHKNCEFDYTQFDEQEVHCTRSCKDCDFIHKTIISRRV